MKDLPMDAGNYRFLLWQLIAALDTGKYDTLSIDDVRHNARAGSISKLLRTQFASVADFSMYSDEDWASLDSEISSMENATDSLRKFGVEKRGISLLFALALQGVQMKESR